MAMKPPPIGDQELELLRYISDRGAPVTVREVAQEWGEPRGLARTTILTVMERLRQKKVLVRERGESENSFRYRPAIASADLMRSLVADFVEKTLGGSLAPFVAYLNDTPSLSKQERDELRRLVESLDAPEEEGR